MVEHGQKSYLPSADQKLPERPFKLDGAEKTKILNSHMIAGGYELLFAGVGASLIGAIAGAWISSSLTYGFQKKLLKQQLDFQKSQAELDADERKRIAKELNGAIKDLRDVIHHKRMSGS